jgi:hypothetical protein
MGGVGAPSLRRSALRPDDGMEKIDMRRERGSSERGATRVTSEADDE